MKRRHLFLATKLFLLLAGLIMFGIGVTNFVLEMTLENYSITRSGPLAFVVTQHLTAGSLTFCGIVCFIFSLMLFSQERSLKQRREILKNNPQSQEDQHSLLRHWFQKQRTYNLYCSLHLCFWIGLTSLLLIGLGSVSLALIVQISNPTIKSSVNEQNDATKSGLLQMGAALLGVSCGLCVLGCIPMFIFGSYLIHIFRNKEEGLSSIEGKPNDSHHMVANAPTGVAESKYVLISNQDLDDEGMDDDDDIMLIQRATIEHR